MFYLYKKLIITKKFHPHDNFLCQIEISLLNMYEIFEIPLFFRIPGFLATLILVASKS